MAIPVGTTARQLAFIGRWMLTAIMIAGSLMWWHPGYKPWGALMASVLVVLLLWLLWRTVSTDNRVPGHPLHMVLAVPAVILTVHFVRAVFGDQSGTGHRLEGGLDISMVLHLVLLSAGIMLTQSLLPGAVRHAVVLSLCGASIMGGAAAAMVWGNAPHIHSALTLLGFGGVAIWLSPLWGISLGAAGQIHDHDAGVLPQALRRRDVRMACVGIAVIAAAIFATRSARASVWACGVIGLTLMVGAIVFPSRRVASLLAGGGLAIASALGMLYVGLPFMVPADDIGGAFGRGEQAFDALSASDGGLALLLGTTGWVGLVAVVLGSITCVLWMLINVRRSHPSDQGRAIVWTVATVLVSCALLAGGGLFLPLVTLAAALVWGMLPAMLDRRPRRRSGIMLLVPVIGLMLMLGFARNGGLAAWSVEAFGLNDKFFHVLTGLLLAASFAWLFGSRKWWGGLIAIGTAALLGGAGELVQLTATSWRGANMSDWIAHIAGSSAVVLPYLLCVGSRMCESSDARSGPASAYQTHAYQRRPQ